MRTFAGCLRPWSLVPAALGLGMLMFGCGTQTTVPGPDSIGSSTPGLSFTYLKWKEGTSLLLVDDIFLGGSHHSGGSGTTQIPIYSGSGSAKAADGGGYKWQVETKDGKTIKFSIDGKDYDLSKGTLFVMKVKGDKTDVHQLKRDLSAIPFDSHKCEEALKKDAEVMKLLGPAELPKKEKE
jgi:hypothetical protein